MILEDLKCEWCRLSVHNCKCSDEENKFHFVHKDDLDLVPRFDKNLTTVAEKC